MEGPSSSHSPPGFAEDSRSLARTTDCCKFNVSVVKASDVSKIFVSWVTYSRSLIPLRVNFRKVWSWSVCAKERSDCLCLPRRVESKPKVISTTCRDWTYSWKLELQHLNAIIKVSFHLWFRRASYMCSIKGSGAFHKIQRAWVSNLFSSCPFLCQNAFALHPRGLSRVGQDTGWQSAVVGHVQDFTDESPCCKVPPRFTESWNRLKKDSHTTRFAWHSHTRTSSHALPWSPPWDFEARPKVFTIAPQVPPGTVKQVDAAKFILSPVGQVFAKQFTHIARCLHFVVRRNDR